MAVMRRELPVVPAMPAVIKLSSAAAVSAVLFMAVLQVKAMLTVTA